MEPIIVIVAKVVINKEGFRGQLEIGLLLWAKASQERVLSSRLARGIKPKSPVQGFETAMARQQLLSIGVGQLAIRTVKARGRLRTSNFTRVRKALRVGPCESLDVTVPELTEPFRTQRSPPMQTDKVSFWNRHCTPVPSC